MTASFGSGQSSFSQWKVVLVIWLLSIQSKNCTTYIFRSFAFTLKIFNPSQISFVFWSMKKVYLVTWCRNLIQLLQVLLLSCCLKSKIQKSTQKRDLPWLQNFSFVYQQMYLNVLSIILHIWLNVLFCHKCFYWYIWQLENKIIKGVIFSIGWLVIVRFAWNLFMYTLQILSIILGFSTMRFCRKCVHCW